MYPIVRDVLFENKQANITLSGTLMMPNSNKPHPVALLIAGMGPNDRDATNYFGFKPFLALSDYLVQNGIAVLRYDKRGVAKSTGVLDGTVTSKDLADDVVAGITFLKSCPDIDPQKIGLIGHSEGGLIASLIAAQSPDVAWVIFMAGALTNSTKGLVAQVEVQLRADGARDELIKNNSKILTQIYELVRTTPNAQAAEQQLKTIVDHYCAQLSPDLAQEAEQFVFALNKNNAESRIALYNSAWYRFFFHNNPAEALAHIAIPVLALYGEHDFMAPHLVKPELDNALAHNKDYTFIVIPKVNHSFQTCKSAALAEYATAQDALAKSALTAMTDWILTKVE